jgi:CheY-like chemotaxis protein
MEGGTMAAVLLVEDDEFVRQMLHWLLADEGYTVAEAADGAAGLAALRASPSPLVVLLDHLLPAMKGCDVLDLVEHDRALQRHAYIYLTAVSPSDLRNEYDDLPRDVVGDVIYKPFRVDQLLRAVAAAEARCGANA